MCDVRATDLLAFQVRKLHVPQNLIEISLHFIQSESEYVHKCGEDEREKRREKTCPSIFTGSFHFKSLMRFNKTQLDDSLTETTSVRSQIKSDTFYSKLMQMLLI